MSAVATIAAVSTAVVAVAGTAYTMISASSRQQSGGGGGQVMPQQMQMPNLPQPVAAPEPEPVPGKETAAPKLEAEAPDPARGVQGTVMTGGLGDTSETKTKKKTLLGS
jgi:hypothetical protein